MIVQMPPATALPGALQIVLEAAPDAVIVMSCDGKVVAWSPLAEKLFGWSADSIQPELAKRVDGFHQEQFFFHNSYLEVAVNHGVLGLGLYLWVLIDLFRVGRKIKVGSFVETHFVDQKFRSLWPVLAGVYLLNASFVVMNYQFVNGFLFTLAGILAAQNRRNSVQVLTY